jgi:hypothetical protein
VLLALLLCFCRLQDEHWQQSRTIVFTGLLLGVAGLLSPSLLPAGFLMAVAEFISRRADRRRVVVGCAVMALITGLLLAPWAIRNYLTLGKVIPFRSNFGLELAIGNNPQANGMTHPPPSDEPPHPLTLHPYLSSSEQLHLAEVGECTYMHEKLWGAIGWVRASPGKALALTGRRFCLFWFPPPELWGQDSPGRNAKAAVFTLIGFGALAALVGLVLLGNRRSWLLAGAVIGPSLIYLVTHVDTRYRYPIFALTTLLSAHLLFSVLSPVAKRLRSEC